MKVCVIGGGGTIGSTIAYTVSMTLPTIDISLVDIDFPPANAHAVDITHASSHRSHPAGASSHTPESFGTITATEPNSETIDSADIIVIPASAPRPASGAQRGGRMTYLRSNLAVATEIGTLLQPLDPRPVICITNPVDRITYTIWRASEWPRTSIIGYSLSETARLADWLARRFEVDPSSVSCPIMGEHGEHIVPVFSRAAIGDKPLQLSAEDRQIALDYVRDIPYEIIQARGAEHSSRWVTARGVGLLIERLIRADLHDSVCLSVPLDGEYGYADVCLSVPIELSTRGWSKILEWDLSDWERKRLDRAYSSVAESLQRD